MAEPDPTSAWAESEKRSGLADDQFDMAANTNDQLTSMFLSNKT
jgi:hypothetical protein